MLDVAPHVSFDITTSQREDLVEITGRIADIVEESDASALVAVFVPHTSAAVTINENADNDVQRDMLMWLERLVPNAPEFRHAEGNSDAHIKASLIGNTVVVPAIDGQLRLGTWQGIFLWEFDGPRTRRVEVMLR